MRERDDVGRNSMEVDEELLSDHLGEGGVLREDGRTEHFADRKLSDGEDDLGSKDLDLTDEKFPARMDLFLVGLSVSPTLGVFAGEAASDCGKVDFFSESVFIKRADFLEPLEESFSGGVREGLAEFLFVGAWCLSDEQDVCHVGMTVHRSAAHSRTSSAGTKLFLEGFKIFHLDRDPTKLPKD